MLEKILKELKYQTKLMEAIFEKKDEHQSKVDEMNKSLENLKKELDKHPIMEGEPGKMLSRILSSIQGVK